MDKEEFISQLLEYKKELFLLAYSVVRNYDDAEDAVAETMLIAYEKIHTLRDKRRFKFWLMQILVNNARTILRKNKRIVCVDKMDSYIPGEQAEMSDVWQTVMSLEYELRVIVTLYYYQGFQVGEIAEMVKIPEGTVKSRLHRARQQLRVLLCS